MDVLEDEEKMKEIQTIRIQEIDDWKKENSKKEVLEKYNEERMRYWKNMNMHYLFLKLATKLFMKEMLMKFT